LPAGTPHFTTLKLGGTFCTSAFIFPSDIV